MKAPASTPLEHPQHGVSTVSYVYGLDLISRTASAGSQEYYLTDGLGSTTGLTTGTGTQTDTYGYDAFGAVRSRTGTSANEFTYTGEQNDTTGLEYLRARYYDSANGRFIGKDPLPLLQRYAYVGNNPVNLVDPSGLWPCGWCKPPKPSIEGIVEWTKERFQEEKQLAEPLHETAQHIGYVDLNLTACLPGLGVCGTGGVQVSGQDGIHPYVGAGVGVGYGVPANWAPGQSISTGWNCASQASVGYFSFQAGQGGIATDKEGGIKSTTFGEIGLGLGQVYASTCFYVF